MSEARTRSQIAQSAAAALRARADHMADIHAFVGFDGFIDIIMRVVDRRRSMAYDDFESLQTIGDFAARAAAAAGRSANIEVVTNERRFGGNGPLLAGALGRFGVSVTFVGAVGEETEPTKLHPIFGPFAERCRRVLPIAPPCVTEAFEFEDGKLMFGHTQNAQQVTWERVVEVVGLDRLIEAVDEASLIGIVNWTIVGGVEGIWRGLIREVFPKLGRKERRIFIDLSDPAKRSDADLGRGLGVLSDLGEHAKLTLGLNLAESQRVARVLGVPAPTSEESARTSEDVPEAAAAIRRSLGIDRVVIHRRDGAGAADARVSAWLDGPFTRNPMLSTGAGDHFNAGFATAEQIGLGVEECVAVACATSGLYVREGMSPTCGRVASFLDALPMPER